MSKIMILKAIHNLADLLYYLLQLFPNVKDNDFESNSQQHKGIQKKLTSCFRMSKIMILKAIHNPQANGDIVGAVVSECQR